jgi:MYXO-CTERM domain-containing protein
MHPLRLSSPLIGSAVFLLSALGTSAAWAADECKTDADCGQGLECIVTSSGSCPGAPPCVPGSSCPEPEPCEIVEQKACAPAHCTSDAQCGAGWVCHAWETNNCVSTDCACSSEEPECNCGAPPPDCAPETESYCTPRYLLPCATATDCGEGFDCVEEQRITCPTSNPSSGSGGAPSSGSSSGSAGASSGQADPAQPAPPPDNGFAKPAAPEPEAPAPDPISACSNTPTGVFACVPKTVSCDATSDCPAGWLCVQEPSEPAPACPPDGCTEPAPAPAPPPARLCRPEYDRGTSSNDSGSNPGLSGSPSPRPPVSPESAAPKDADSSRESSACQMGRAPASHSAFSLLVVLGALVGLRRKRR